MNKKELYSRMDGFRDAMGLDYESVCVNPFDICRKLNIYVALVELSTVGLRGVALPSPDRQEDIIILNSKRDFTQRKFDCAHELTHLLLHTPHKAYLQKVNDVAIAQNDYTEWEANEGAAELLMPYRVFIPKFTQEMREYRSEASVQRRLARYFKVTEQNVAFRVKGLQYEIWQYGNGQPLDKIHIISRKEQSTTGIAFPSDFRYLI